MAGTQNQFIVFIPLLIFAYWLVMDRRSSGIIALGIMLAFHAALNTYWLLNFFAYRSLNVAALTQSSPTKALASALVDHGIPMQQGFTVTGFWDPLFRQSITSYMRIPWFIAGLFIVLTIFSLLLARRDRRDYLFLTVAVLGLVAAKGGRAPFGFATIWLYRKVVALSLFRSLQHMLFFPSLAYALLIGLAFAHYRQALDRRKARVFALVLSVSFLVYVHPALSGDMSGLLQTFGSRKDDVAIAKLDRVKGPFRVLYLPMAASPLYDQSASKHRTMSGTDPAVRYSPIPTLVDDAGPSSFARDLAPAERRFYGGQATRIEQFAKKANVRYLVLRAGMRQAHVGGMEAFDFDVVDSQLKKNRRLKLVTRGPGLRVYEIKNTLPKIHASAAPAFSSLERDSLDLLYESGHLDSSSASLLLDSSAGVDGIAPESLLKTRRGSPLIAADSTIADLALDILPRRFKYRYDGQAIKLSTHQDGNYEIWIKKKILMPAENSNNLTSAAAIFSGTGHRAVRTRLRLSGLLSYTPTRWHKWGSVRLLEGEHTVRFSGTNILGPDDDIVIAPATELRKRGLLVTGAALSDTQPEYIFSGRILTQQARIAEALRPQTTYTSTQMSAFSHDGKLVVDEEAITDKALKNGSISGPYDDYSAGIYSAAFRIKADARDPEKPVATIDVVTGGGARTLASKTIAAADFGDKKAYSQFVLPFTVSKKDAGQLEFRVHYLRNGDLWVDRVQVRRELSALGQSVKGLAKRIGYLQKNTLSARFELAKPASYRALFHLAPSGTPAPKTYWPYGIKAYSAGRLVKDSTMKKRLVLLNGSTAGPYDVYPAGTYRVSFHLRSYNPRKRNRPVVGIDVVTGGAAKTLASRIIYQSDFRNDKNYRVFTLPVKVTLPEAGQLEFRLHYFRNSSIRLKKIVAKSVTRMPELGPGARFSIDGQSRRLGDMTTAGVHDLGVYRLKQGAHRVLLDPESNTADYRLQLKPTRKTPSLPKISFSRNSPVQYVASVAKAKEPFLLVFSETFHPGWKAYLVPKSGRLWPWSVLTARRLPESAHLAADGFANAWWITDKGDYRLVLFYQPQLLYSAGLAASAVFFVILAWLWVRSKTDE